MRLVLRYARVPRQTASDEVHFLINGMTSVWSTCVPGLAPFSVGYIELKFKIFLDDMAVDFDCQLPIYRYFVEVEDRTIMVTHDVFEKPLPKIVGSIVTYGHNTVGCLWHRWRLPALIRPQFLLIRLRNEI